MLFYVVVYDVMLCCVMFCHAPIFTAEYGPLAPMALHATKKTDLTRFCWCGTTSNIIILPWQAVYFLKEKKHERSTLQLYRVAQTLQWYRVAQTLTRPP